MAMLPFPKINEKDLFKSFDVQIPPNVEITSIEITSNGAYILCGFGNGEVLCISNR